MNWRVMVSADCKLDERQDAFGNITHSFTAEGPLNELVVHVEGQVEIENTQGLVRGAVERFPPEPVPARNGADRGRSDAIAATPPRGDQGRCRSGIRS